MNASKKRLINDLKQRWHGIHWPSNFPGWSSDLNEAACDLVEYDTFVAGCLSQIVSKGKLDQKLWPILRIDDDLTWRIAKATDPQKQEFLNYKTELDECIRMAQKILNIPKPIYTPTPIKLALEPHNET